MPVKETLPPLREDHHGVIPPVERRLSLFDIERDKAELIQFREECTTPEEIAAVDQKIQEYIGREIRKVSGIAALLRYFRSHAEVAKAEKERAAKWQQVWEGRYERLKNMVHGVMMALDIPKVEGATDRLRRQKNPVALEITDAAAIPVKYLRATIKMPFAEWRLLLDAAAMSGKPFSPTLDSLQVGSEVDTAALKTALQVKVKCKECDGDGVVQVRPSGHGHADDLAEYEPCVVCDKTGQVLATVPGARLVQGEHLRVE